MDDAALDALGDRIAETSATLDATIHRLLVDLRAFDAAKGWARHGALTLAHWLNWRCGISLGPAREKVRVAHALCRLPLIDEALRLVQATFSQLRPPTRLPPPPHPA